MEKPSTEQIVQEYSEITTQLMSVNQHSRQFREAQRKQRDLLAQAPDEALQAISLESGISTEELKEWRILFRRALEAKTERATE
jgi:hypothetical protein